MVDDDGLEYAVPHYRDPGKTARIVAARRRGERVKDIAAREGVSHQRVSLHLPGRRADRQAVDGTAAEGLRRVREAPAEPLGHLLLQKVRRGGAVLKLTPGNAFTSFGATVRPHGPRSRMRSAGAPICRSPRGDSRRRRAHDATPRTHGLPWPLPDRAKAERLARRAEKAGRRDRGSRGGGGSNSGASRRAAEGQDDNRA